MAKKVRTFRLSDDSYEALVKAANKDDRTASDYLERLLKKLFKIKSHEKSSS